ncbi:hypothetical protein ACFL1H_00405 [Nanoarchaeota archaeon]
MMNYNLNLAGLYGIKPTEDEMKFTIYDLISMLPKPSIDDKSILGLNNRLKTGLGSTTKQILYCSEEFFKEIDSDELRHLCEDVKNNFEPKNTYKGTFEAKLHTYKEMEDLLLGRNESNSEDIKTDDRKLSYMKKMGPHPFKLIASGVVITTE